MVICSAPGKIFLFGEHAVVYGEPAIACAIELRTSVRVREGKKSKIASPYVAGAVKKISEVAEFEGVNIDIHSDIPTGSGLGSSAAVTIATLFALNIEFDVGLSKEDVAQLGHEVEREVQGAASLTDTFVSTMGGVIFLPSCKRLNSLNCGLVIGNTGLSSSTKEIVGQVAKLKDRHSDIIQPIFHIIGELAKKGEYLVEKKDYKNIGELMNINQGLLESLGVGRTELATQIYAARKAGAFGAKITGAGGGGCMVALVDFDRMEEVASAVESVGGRAIYTKVTETGVTHDG
ncbi:mevalonate kinase [Halobacteriota archaeon]